MSAELEILENGEASMAFTGDRNAVWHRQGVQVPKDLTPEQFLEKAGLNWEVKKVKMRAEMNGKSVKGIDTYALVRDRDNVCLGAVSKTWEPCQNATAFEFFNDFVAQGDMYMDTAGSLFGGRHVWGAAKLNEGFKLFGGDEVEGHLLFSNPHKFGKSIEIRTCLERVVCHNTISIALSERSKAWARFDHRKKFDPDMAKEMLGMAREQIEQYKEAAEFMSKKMFKKEDIVDYFSRIFPVTGSSDKELSLNARRCVEVLDTQPGVQYARGSMWQLFNATTYVLNHPKEMTDTKQHSLWYGGGAAKCNEALKVALEMAA